MEVGPPGSSQIIGSRGSGRWGFQKRFSETNFGRPNLLFEVGAVLRHVFLLGELEVFFLQVQVYKLIVVLNTQ